MNYLYIGLGVLGLCIFLFILNTVFGGYRGGNGNANRPMNCVGGVCKMPAGADKGGNDDASDEEQFDDGAEEDTCEGGKCSK